MLGNKRGTTLIREGNCHILNLDRTIRGGRNFRNGRL